MGTKWLKGFLGTASVILLGTGLAKMLSAVTGEPVLRTYDPVFGVNLGLLFWVAGMLEVIVALFCLFQRRMDISAILIFWLSAIFLVYRLGWSCMGGPAYCGCLGTIPEQLHLDPVAADLTLKLILAYLLSGSALVLGIILKRRGCVDASCTV